MSEGAIRAKLPTEMSDAELLEHLKDPRWRIRNLYYIMDKDGNEVLFVPNEVQDQFIDDLWYRNVVPKARQRGFSTVVQILILDACLFEENLRAAIIAQDRNTATQIFNDKIKFAYDRLPELLRQMVPIVSKTKTELQFANNSSVRVATSVRGGTLQWLHVSEYGKICQKFPDKAAEIQTGSLPAVDQNGIVVVESTVESLEGAFTDMVRSAMAQAQSGRPLGKMDYKLHFASWWDAREYETNPSSVIISSKDAAYFERLEAEINRPISPRKRAWYVQKRDKDFAGDQEKMWMQYPSTVEEAFTVSTEGTWLADQLALMRREDRITTVPYDPSVPVNTFWDLGVDDDIAIWFHQQIGTRDHFIDYVEGSGEPYAWFVAQMQQRNYVWGHHYLPHDGAHRRPGSEQLKTSADMLEDLGLKDIVIVPRIHELLVGIQQLRDAMSFYWIDETKCAEGVKHLAGYKKVWNERMGTWSSQVLRNGHQHAADAIRQHAQIRDEIRRSGTAKRPKRRNSGAMAV